MSIVTLQVGQCGNQVGQEFFNDLVSEYATCEDESMQAKIYATYFQESKYHDKILTPNAILIDMETKVVNKCLKNKGNFDYDKGLAFTGEGGSGNNWAFGYNKASFNLKNMVQEGLRKTLEKIDYLGGLLMMQSLAGGTGSGLGAYLTQMLREEFPKQIMLNTVIVPYSSGEVLVQSYNYCLTMSTLLKESDGIIMFDNDDLLLMAKELLKQKHPTIQDMNQIISHHLISTLLPTRNKVQHLQPLWGRRGNILENICENLLINPSYKLLSIKGCPIESTSSKEFSNESWDALANRLKHMVLSDTTEANIQWHNPNLKCIGNMVYMRGKDAYETECSKLFESKEMYSNNCEYLGCTEYRDSHELKEYPRSMAMITNSQCKLSKIDNIIERATAMYINHAFLHHYKKYDISSNEFADAFLSMEHLLHNYIKLNPLAFDPNSK